MSFGAPAFGAPAFGRPAFGAPAFGSPAFGAPSQPTSTGQSVFGAAPRMTPAQQQPQKLPKGDLSEVQTEAIGFTTIDGDSKLRLASTWPRDNPPAATSSLLSVSSARGLVAAAGPDEIIVATTANVRNSIRAPSETTEKAFKPELRIPMPLRVSFVAFSSDGSFLVVSAEQGGGLAIYSTDSLLQGNIVTSMELSTQGIALRALLPNHAEASSHLIACVTMQGDLLMADLKQQSFTTGQNGNVLLQKVCSVAWSPKGKQLVAGLGEGAATQLTPTGVIKAQIPRPPGCEPNDHVSSLAWLRDDVFVLILTPWSSTATDTSGQPPSSNYFLVTRSGEQYVHQKLVDPCPPYDMPRMPAKHFITRLQSAPPNLDDILVVASTVSSDINLLVKARVPLSPDPTASNGINKYVTAMMADDTRRAQMPMTQDFQDTSPIGAAFDFSAEEKAPRPIPGDEMDESSTPLPAYFVLNNEGILVAWWLVYNEAVRAGLRYPGLMPTPAVSGADAQSGQQTVLQPFGQAISSATSGFSGLVGSTSTALSGGAGNAFGQATGFGNKLSPWGSSTSASTLTSSGSVFGATSGIGGAGHSAFGSAGSLGNNSSPWASVMPGKTESTKAPAPSDAAQPSGGLFSSVTPATSGFALHASTGGFSAFTADPAKQGKSIFGTDPAASSDGSVGTTSAWGASPSTKESAFGGQFQLQSAFKRDPESVSEEAPAPAGPSEASMFGDSFAQNLGERQDINEVSSTAITIVKSPEEGGKHDIESAIKTGAQDAVGTEVEKPDPSSFDDELRVIDNEDYTHQAHSPEAPLPPEPTSKATYGPGESSGSSMQDVPLAIEKQITEGTNSDTHKPSERDDRITLSREGSGEMVYPPTESSNSNASEMQKPEGTPPAHSTLRLDTTTPKTSPEASGSLTGSFEEIERSSSIDASDAPPSRPAAGKKPLFGEIGLSTTPFLPPPQPALLDSPRSPSPVRLPDRDQHEGDMSSAHSQALLERQYLDRARPSERGQVRKNPIRFIPDRSKSNDHQLAVVSQISDRGSVDFNINNGQDHLSEDEDRLVRAELEDEIVSTRTLAPFLAHHDYIGHIRKEGIPGQIERVCRDVSSMIDTIGLNAKRIRAWTEGHEQYKEGGRPIEDLESLREEEWVMVEVSDLGVLIEGGLSRGISGHVSDEWQDQVHQLREVEIDLLDITSQASRFKQVVEVERNTDSEDRSTQAQSLQKSDLRKGLRDLQTLLVEAEQSVSLLQAKMTALQGDSRPERASPSVDAVVRTIAKMMRMIESKAVDIDVLEQHMRGLQLNGDSLDLGTSKFSSANENSAYKRSSMSASRTGAKQSPTATQLVKVNGSLSPPTTQKSVTGSGLGQKQIRPQAILQARERMHKQRLAFGILQKLVRTSPPKDMLVAISARSNA